MIIHETGHFCGLPDYYDTASQGEGLGSHCIMANSWGNRGTQSCHPSFSAPLRHLLGWLDGPFEDYVLNVDGVPANPQDLIDIELQNNDCFNLPHYVDWGRLPNGTDNDPLIYTDGTSGIEANADIQRCPKTDEGLGPWDWTGAWDKEWGPPVFLGPIGNDGLVATTNFRKELP